MGVGKKLLSFVAKEASALDLSPEDVIEKAIEVVGKAEEKTKDKTKDKLIKSFKETPTHSHLVIKSPRLEMKEKYYVWDENFYDKYYISGKLLSLTHHLTVFDQEGNELASIKEKMAALRLSLPFDKKPKDFEIKVGGEKLGNIKTNGSLLKKKFEICFNGWVVEGNILGFNYTVFNGKDVIMKVHQKLLSAKDTYILDIYDPQNELICLVIAIVLDAASMTKGQERRKVIAKTARKVKKKLI